jgi:hypothetical protein
VCIQYHLSAWARWAVAREPTSIGAPCLSMYVFLMFKTVGNTNTIYIYMFNFMYIQARIQAHSARPPKRIGVTGLTIAQGMLNTIFASQGLRSAPLLFTIGRLSRNFGSSRFILLFDAAVGDCIQSKCV